MAGIVIEELTRTFPGGVVAVNNVSLDVRDKELLVLVGPSGCGKTTTLRLIAGLDRPTAGQVWIGGRLAIDMPPRERDVAMVFQANALYPHLTVYQNMAFGLWLNSGGGWVRRTWLRMCRPARSRDMTRLRREMPDRVRQTAGMLSIEGLLGRLPGDLSGGEQQRVALGRAMVRRPAAFLLDEPLSNLDAPLRAELKCELRRLHRRLETTIVYVTHDQAEALTLGQRIAVMDRGVVHQVGTPEEVYEQPKDLFVARFIGSPPMNLLAGRLEPGRLVLRTAAGTIPIDNPLTERLQRYIGRQVMLGIRPHELCLAGESAIVNPPRRVTDSTQPALRAMVTSVETVGDAEIVEAAFAQPAETGSAAGPVVCKQAHSGLRPGDNVRIYFERGRKHLFDPETGANVTIEGE